MCVCVLNRSAEMSLIQYSIVFRPYNSTSIEDHPVVFGILIHEKTIRHYSYQTHTTSCNHILLYIVQRRFNFQEHYQSVP